MYSWLGDTYGAAERDYFGIMSGYALLGDAGLR